MSADRLSILLRRLHERGRICSRLPLYSMEFDYETNSPDPAPGIPLLTRRCR